MGGKYPLKVCTSKVVEVPASSTPKPYKYHVIEPTLVAPSGTPHRYPYYELGVNVQYQSIESLYKSIYKLYELFKAKNSFHYEQDLDKMFIYMHDFVTSHSFDKTRIKSLNEKSQLGGKEFRVKQILPMVQVEGLLYLTNKRVYFQPAHTGIYGSGNTVVNFKLKEIHELF